MIIYFYVRMYVELFVDTRDPDIFRASASHLSPVSSLHFQSETNSSADTAISSNISNETRVSAM